MEWIELPPQMVMVGVWACKMSTSTEERPNPKLRLDVYDARRSRDGGRRR